MAKEEAGMACCSGDFGKMVVLAALLLAGGMIGCGYFMAQGDYSPDVNITGGPTSPNVYVSSTPPEHTIYTSATSSRDVAPDLLLVSVRVQTEGSNAKGSQEDNAEVMADLLSNLKALGLNESDIQTTRYSVDPVYDSQYVCDSSGNRCHYDSKLIGYRTVHSLSVKVTELDKGGDVIDEASSAGVNQTFVDYIQFTLKDETRLSIQKSLLQEAAAEAKSKAQSMAAGLGVSVGRVLSVSESYSYYPTANYYKSSMLDYAEAAGAPTQLSAGQVEVSASVGVNFEVGS